MAAAPRTRPHGPERVKRRHQPATHVLPGRPHRPKPHRHPPPRTSPAYRRIESSAPPPGHGGPFTDLSPEQIAFAFAQQRGGARPVVERDVALEPAHAAPPARASPSPRARSAAAAASSAIAITVACSSRPAASGRPRQSSSGARPAQPIATSHWPVAPGPPERVGDDDRRGDPEPRRAGWRAARAPSRRGRAGAGSRARARPRWTASTPALAHTKPWCVRQISTARRRRARSRPTRSSIDLDEARVLAVLGRERAGVRPGLDLSERDDPRPRPWRPPLSDREHVAVREAAVERRGGGREQRAEVVARPHLGQAGQRRGLRCSPGRRRGEALEDARACAGPHRAASSSAARSAARSPGVSTSSASDGACATAHARAAGARRARAWRAQRARAEGGHDRAGRRKQQRVRALPWRSGTITTRPSPVVREQGVELGRDRARGSRPGRAARARRRAARPRPRRARRRRSGRPRRGRRPPAPPRARRAPRARSSAVTTTTSSSPSHRSQRGQHVARPSPPPAPGASGLADRVAEALLGAVEALDGQDGGGAHGATLSGAAEPEREPERGLGDAAARPSASAISTSVSSVGTSLGALVGDDAVEQPGVVRRRCRPRSADGPPRP